MRADSVKAPTEQVQTQPTVFFEQKFDTKYGELVLKAINSKGEHGTFDKIILNLLHSDFEVKEIYYSNVEMLGSDGIRDNMVAFNEVKADTYLNGELRRSTFIDPYVTAYVKALVNYPANESNVHRVNSKTRTYVLNYNNDFYLPNYYYIENYLSGYNVLQKGDYGKLIPELTKSIEGSYGKYKVKFYDTDSDMNTFENVSVEGENGKEFMVSEVGKANLKLTSIDADLEGASTIYMNLSDGLGKVDFNRIFDYNLGEFLIEQAKSEKNNGLIINPDISQGELKM